jgi:DNA-binding PadR family transcriptional regulator
VKSLSKTELELLLALGAQKLNGRELAKRYRQEHKRNISFGTLYTTMARLRDQGWVSQEDSEDDDGRIRYFRITGDGVRAVQEARRGFTRLIGLIGERFA